MALSLNMSSEFFEKSSVIEAASQSANTRQQFGNPKQYCVQAWNALFRGKQVPKGDRESATQITQPETIPVNLDRLRRKLKLMKRLRDRIGGPGLRGDVGKMNSKRCLNLDFLKDDGSSTVELKGFIASEQEINLITAAAASKFGWKFDDDVREILEIEPEPRSVVTGELVRIIGAFESPSVYVRETRQHLQDLLFFVIPDNEKLDVDVILGFEDADRYAWCKLPHVMQSQD